MTIADPTPDGPNAEPAGLFDLPQGFVDIIMNGIVAWWSDSWTSSGTKSLVAAMRMLQSTSWPVLNAAWFKMIYDNFLGLLILFVLALLLVRFFTYAAGFSAFTRITSMVGEACRVIGCGICLLVGLYFAMRIVDMLSTAMMYLIVGQKYSPDSTQWFSDLIKNSPAGGANLFLQFLGMVGGFMLHVQALFVQNCMYIFAIAFMFAYAARNAPIGYWVYQSSKAMLLVTLIVPKLIQMGWLGLWAVFIRNLDMLQEAKGVLSVIVIFLAGCFPLVVYASLIIKKVRSDGRAKVEGKVKTERDDDRAYGGRYASSFNRGYHRTKEVVRQSVTVAGASLLTVGIERGGSWLSKKAAGAGRPEVAMLIKGASNLAGKASSGLRTRYPGTEKAIDRGTKVADYAYKKYRSTRPGGRTSQSEIPK